jgi:hypothetical protein
MASVVDVDTDFCFGDRQEIVEVPRFNKYPEIDRQLSIQLTQSEILNQAMIISQW